MDDEGGIFLFILAGLSGWGKYMRKAVILRNYKVWLPGTNATREL
jgi:hypothetical protein